MANSSNIPGNQNIVIQDVSESTITLNVNGEVQKIQNQLVELKTLLEKLKVQKVQYAEKIYNIGNINEAKFGYITGKTRFNETLTKQLVGALQSHDPTAKRIADQDNWHAQPRNVAKVQSFLANRFVGVIGKELSKLMAIGREGDTSEDKLSRYVKKCIHLTKWSFDLICFALLSELWEVKKEKPLKFTDTQLETLTLRFEQTLEPTINEQFNLLKVLHEIYSNNKLSFPIHELGEEQNDTGNFSVQFQEDSELHKICSCLQDLNEKVSGQYDLLDCYEAETQLAAFFGYFYFLINYKMASIKRIGYRQIRNDEPHYLHRYTALGIDNTDEKLKYTPETVDTHAVLLYSGDNYLKNVNLFPFVLDYNALVFEDKAKICFYSSKNFDGKGLEFLYLDDHKPVQLEKQDILKKGADVDELLLDKDKGKIFNLDCVVDQFNEAKRCLLGSELDFDNL